jgi:hypothetical protein
VLSSILWNDFSITYRLEYTFSNCHFVCHPDKEVRKARYMMLTESGVIIQEPDGTLRTLYQEEAKKYIESIPKRRKLYESIPEED